MLFKLIIVALLYGITFGGTGGYTEWQTGVDRTVNGQEKFRKPQYPMQFFTKITFPRKFSRLPQVLIMHQEIEWNKNRNINYQTFVTDISINGFYLNYVFRGPAIIPILRLRWVALVDSFAEVRYVNYQFDDLIRLRQGFGMRFNDFTLQYSLKFPTPKVAAFLIGAEIEIDNASSTSLQVQLGRATGSFTPVRFITKDKCHINTIRMAYIISSDELTLIDILGSSNNYFNKFSDNSNQVALRIQRFEREVPITYTLESFKNILAQGITGFDVSSKAGSCYLRVGGEYIDTEQSLYKCSFGTRGDTVLQSLQMSYVLHGPALPPISLIQENDEQQKQNNF